MFFLQLFVLLSSIAALVAAYFYNAYKFWTKQGVPIVPPRFPLGNTNVLLPRGLSMGIRSKKFYDYFKLNDQKFGGVYLVTEPNLVIVDPDYVKAILCKDFSNFVNRGFYYNQKDDPISANLFAIDGIQWKNLRAKLTPTFTSGKMKMMFGAMKECQENLIEALNKNVGFNLDIKEMLAKYTTDVIGCCAFGIECNSFKFPDALFRRMGQKSFHFDLWRSLRAFLIANLPQLSLKLGITGNNKEIRDFFMNMVEDSVKMRQENGIKRNDFLQILIDLRETTDFTLPEMAAQMFLFFLAGFETSANSMSFCLYELAANPDLQEKLRQEINNVLKQNNDEFTYENLHTMKYLAQVFKETLRKYPPAPTLNRRCSIDYTLPGTDYVIKSGTRVLISCYGLHWDPEFYPEPQKFNPERFSEVENQNRQQFLGLSLIFFKLYCHYWCYSHYISLVFPCPLLAPISASQLFFLHPLNLLPFLPFPYFRSIHKHTLHQSVYYHPSPKIISKLSFSCSPYRSHQSTCIPAVSYSLNT